MPLFLLAADPFDAVADYVKSTGGTALVIGNRDAVLRSWRFDGQAEDAPVRLASGSKSFWGVLAVRLQEAGKLRLTDRLGDYLPAYKELPTTVRDLLTLTSGVRGATMVGPEAAARTVPTIDGFSYGPAPFQVFGAYLSARFGKDPTVLLKEVVTDPLPMDVAWARALSPQRLAGSAAVGPITWSKFGRMVLRDAKLRSELTRGTEINPAYGLTWWLPNGKGTDAISRRELGGVVLPDGTLVAAGLGKQRLYVIPAWDLVVVRTGPLNGRAFEDAKFVRLLTAAYGKG